MWYLDKIEILLNNNIPRTKKFNLQYIKIDWKISINANDLNKNLFLKILRIK